ncbi:MAG TPA: helix-turn-helix domain-containing protein [Chroococcales cyanobacterium]|jgi:DNA-binding transcriptional MerR regulator
MTTAEVARRLGVSPTTARTWATALGLAIARNAKGHREYSAEDLDRLEAARETLAKGESISGEEKMPRLVEFFEKQLMLSERLEKIIGRLENPGEDRIVSGVLKQLLAQLLAAQGKLVAIDTGADRIVYLAPGNVRHVVDIACRSPEERRLLDSVVAILVGRKVESR